MIQTPWSVKAPAWWAVPRLVQIFFLLVAPLALAEPVTVNPETELSLEFSAKGATTCILVPEKRYDAQACAGIPQKEASAREGEDQSVRALVILRQPEQVFILTVASIKRPEIGQMYDQNIRGFIEGTLKRLTEDFGATARAVEDSEKPYTVQQVRGVPVARWEYTTELPEEDERANTASAVVYLIPSRDTLDVLSINTHQRDLAEARAVGEQVISTLKLPLTIKVEEFGGDMTFALGKDIASVLVLAALVIGLGVAMWRRSRKAPSSVGKRDDTAIPRE
ncbi:hypothetical protein [Hyalangium sp.]|uniref:hypothetical protein n=1 Tax=Hyalangium sp. TaxID=2028555 RepID=UPI002D3D10FA|nr:hypothetical protein [Hyalangium sp.]HYI00544.1 hypothetical protein [Hyalangium sp.]